jgi:1-deoxy-D-xylulose-5-phosphate reductoisomerase
VLSTDRNVDAGLAANGSPLSVGAEVAWLRPPVDRVGPQRLAIFGCTGSIGSNTLEVLRHATKLSSGASRYQLVGVSGHRRWRELAAVVEEFKPRRVVCTDASAAANWIQSQPDIQGKLEVGGDALVQLAMDPEVDTVVAAIVGGAGLASTLAAIRAGKTVALANKETLVMAGHLATDWAQTTGSRILPVDSEHSAILQAMLSGAGREIRRVVLTASGGPFRTWPSERQAKATPSEALAHPTWQMGQKISIDSATMMNKALEVIEAKWLFGLRADQIDVVVHPQSVVHSFVEFCDGSVMAQLSPPDMKLPIQYALDFPTRHESPATSLDFCQAFQLHFEPPDSERFPALSLGLEVADQGGSCGVVLNAANEVAVQAFLDGRLSFPRIVQTCRQVLNAHPYEAYPDLETILNLDRWARLETLKCISN